MKKSFLSMALIGMSLSVTAVCSAGTTPDATLKEFMAAMKKKDRKSIQSLVDWDGMAGTMNMGNATPEQKARMMRMMKTVYTEGFALGKKADEFKISPVTTKGTRATASLMKNDKATKKWVPTTNLLLHKKGKEWQIYGISGAKKS